MIEFLTRKKYILHLCFSGDCCEKLKDSDFIGNCKILKGNGGIKLI